MANSYVHGVSTFVFALALTCLVLPVLARYAGRIGLLDLPNRRKIHNNPKPLVGGVAMIAGVLITSIIYIPPGNFGGYFFGLIVLLIVGFLDDFRDLNHRVKFIAQFLAMGAVIFLDDVVLASFGEILPGLSVNLAYLGIPVTFFAGIGVINAVNMADGLDGLAGGLTLTAFTAFSFLAYLNGQPGLMLLSLAFCAVLVVFMFYNWHPASLFMGDAGSLTLGFSLVFIGIVLSQSGRGLVPPATILLIMAVPITDTLTVMSKRMLRRKSPFRPDKTHFHHLLLRFGFTKMHSTLTIIAIALFLSGVGISGVILQIPAYWLMAVFLVYALLYALFVFRASKVLRVKLRITCGKNHLSGGIALHLAKLLDGAERLVKIRWEGYQFSIATPTPCTLIRGDEESLTVTIRSISTKGFVATSDEVLSHGEEIKADLRLLDENIGRQAREIKLRIPAKVYRITVIGNTVEYAFRFVHKKRSVSRKLTNFLQVDHNLTGNFRPPPCPFTARKTGRNGNLIPGKEKPEFRGQDKI